LEDCHDNYDPAHLLWLDDSTSYSEIWQDHYVHAVERIHDYRPNARTLFLVRHPMARMISEWRQFVYLLDAADSTIERNYGMRNPGKFSQDIRRFPGLLENSRCAAALAPFAARFLAENILVLRMEDLLARDAGQVARLGGFLGLDAAALAGFTLEHHNAGSIKGRANPLGRALRAMPGLKGLGARLPLGVKRAIRPLIKRDPDAGLDLTQECIDHCRVALQANTRDFLAAWGFDRAAYDDWDRFRRG
jgi:hypothetical protein